MAAKAGGRRKGESAALAADTDSPWKDILDEFFEDFMRFFWPKAHAMIAWEKGYELLEKELQQMLGSAKTGRLYVDKLVRVYLGGGGETWVLVHVEVQMQPQGNFEERMFVYHARLFLRYRRPVASFVVLGDSRPGWRPDHFGYEPLGCRTRLDFGCAKLLDWKDGWEELERSRNPFAVVVMAHLLARETTRDVQERYRWKWKLVRRLRARGYDQARREGLFRFIHWVLALPLELEDQLDTELQKAEKTMPYITSFERKAMNRARLAAQQEAVVRVLTSRFGKPPEALVAAVQEIKEEEKLLALLDEAARAPDMATFERVLADDEAAGSGESGQRGGSNP